MLDLTWDVLHKKSCALPLIHRLPPKFFQCRNFEMYQWLSYSCSVFLVLHFHSEKLGFKQNFPLQKKVLRHLRCQNWNAGFCWSMCSNCAPAILSCPRYFLCQICFATIFLQKVQSKCVIKQLDTKAPIFLKALPLSHEAAFILKLLVH